MSTVAAVLRIRGARRAMFLAVLLGGLGGVAWGHWTAPTTAGGNGRGVAATVNQGDSPTVTAPTGVDVIVDWDATTLSDGGAVAGYRIKRYHAGTDVLQTILASCTGVVAATSCTETSVPTGSWKYTVTPVIGTNWVGAESVKSSAIATSPDTTDPTVWADLTPAANGAGWNNTSPVSVTLTADDGAGSGVDEIIYTTDGSDPTISGTALVYSTALSIAATTTVKFFATDLAANASSVQTQLVKIDTVAPANAITLSGITGGAYKSGSTVFYRGAAVGSFTLDNAVTDANSGPASSATAALGGVTTGWTHTPSTVTTPAGGPYTSNAFSWGVATTTSPTESVTGADVAGKTAATALTFTDDSVVPTGGVPAASGLVGTGSAYSTGLSLNITLTAVADTGGSGIATGAQLARATGALTSGVCSGYSGYVQVGADDPAFPYTSAVSNDTCYRYQYSVYDRVGNLRQVQSGDIKIDTSAPSAPTFGFTAMSNAYWSGAGSNVYYKRDAASGSFTATATATDAESGIATYAMPNLGTGWTVPSGTTGVQTYAWSAPNPTAPAGAQNATANNNAAATSSAAGFTMISDITAPATGSVTYADGYATAGTVALTLAPGTDGGSGINTTAGLLHRASATLLANGTCSGWTAFATLPAGTNPALSFTDDTVVTAKCYQYKYLASDLVGNQVTYTNANVVKVDYANIVQATASLRGHWRLGESTLAYDLMTGAENTLLDAHTPSSGGTWTKWTHDSTTATIFITNNNAIRRSGNADGVHYYHSVVPASADYRVEADLVVKTRLANDVMGVIGRMDPTNTTGIGTHYMLRYQTDGSNNGLWVIHKRVGNTLTVIGSSAAQNVANATTYRMALDMNGTLIRGFVDGELKVSATDAAIAGAGRAGIRLGAGSMTTSQSNTAGMHLDNFHVTPTMVDSSAASPNNTGDYLEGPTLGLAAAALISGNTAVTFGTGPTTYGLVEDSTSLDVVDAFSLEAWVKRADATDSATMKTIAYKGDTEFRWGIVNNKMTLYKGATLIAQSSTTETDMAYHHYVATKNGATTNLYVDGVDRTVAGTNAAMTANADEFTVGAKALGVANDAIDPLNGTIDELALYNAALSAPVVQMHYRVAGGT